MPTYQPVTDPEIEIDETWRVTDISIMGDLFVATVTGTDTDGNQTGTIRAQSTKLSRIVQMFTPTGAINL